MCVCVCVCVCVFVCLSVCALVCVVVVTVKGLTQRDNFSFGKRPFVFHYTVSSNSLFGKILEQTYLPLSNNPLNCDWF